MRQPVVFLTEPAYFIGDVRDVDRLRRAMQGVDLVIHAAASKQVPACEYNPIEAVLTNVMGARNVIDAALDCQVRHVLAISTDKAVNPINVYERHETGGRKALRASQRLQRPRTDSLQLRPLWQRGWQSRQRDPTIHRATRPWPTDGDGPADDAILADARARRAVRVASIEQMHGGEVFVPKIPSMNIMDLVRVIGPECEIEEVGIRPGEKLHEVLISDDESRLALELDDMFVLQPAHPWWTEHRWPEGRTLPTGFRYASDQNSQWLTTEQLRQAVEQLL